MALGRAAWPRGASAVDSLYNLMQDIQGALATLTAQYGLLGLLAVVIGVPVGAVLVVAMLRSLFSRES